MIELFPSAYKVTKLYSQLPTDGNGDFTFARSTTGTRVSPAGLIETISIDIPRLDYTDDVCPVLKLEPQITNKALRSEEIENATWIKENATVTADKIISPDGTLTADMVDVTAATGSVYQSITVTASTVYNYSFYVKLGTLTQTSFAVFDTSNLAFIFENAAYTAFTDKWVRIDATFTTPVGCTLIRIYANRFSGGGLGTFYYWGAQLEELGYSTSYIPTTSATVTRTADICNNSGTVDDFNSEEGVFYVKIKALDNDLTDRIITISDGTTLNRVEISYSTVSNRIKGAVNVGGVQIAAMLFVASDITVFQKIAVKFKTDDFALFVDDVQVATDSSGTLFAADTLDDFSFDDGSGAFDFYGDIAEAKVYKTIQSAIDDGVIS